MNRAFKYGDAVFETMRVLQGKIPFLSYHLDRLKRSLIYLGMDTEGIDFEEKLRNQIPSDFNGSCRCQVYRQGNQFNISTNALAIEIELHPLEGNFSLNEKGLDLGLYIENYKATSPLNNLKSANYLLFVLAKQYAESRGLDDALIVNGYGNIVEAINANVIVIKEGKWYSPDLASGPVEGVMLKVLQSLGFNIEFKSFNFQEVIEADGVLLCNAVKGIQWVGSFNGFEKARLDQYGEVINALNQSVE